MKKYIMNRLEFDFEIFGKKLMFIIFFNRNKLHDWVIYFLEFLIIIMQYIISLKYFV